MSFWLSQDLMLTTRLIVVETKNEPCGLVLRDIVILNGHTEKWLLGRLRQLYCDAIISP